MHPSYRRRPRGHRSGQRASTVCAHHPGHHHAYRHSRPRLCFASRAFSAGTGCARGLTCSRKPRPSTSHRHHRDRLDAQNSPTSMASSARPPTSAGAPSTRLTHRFFGHLASCAANDGRLTLSTSEACQSSGEDRAVQTRTHHCALDSHTRCHHWAFVDPWLRLLRFLLRDPLVGPHPWPMSSEKPLICAVLSQRRVRAQVHDTDAHPPGCHAPPRVDSVAA